MSLLIGIWSAKYLAVHTETSRNQSIQNAITQATIYTEDLHGWNEIPSQKRQERKHSNVDQTRPGSLLDKIRTTRAKLQVWMSPIRPSWVSASTRKQKMSDFHTILI